MAIPIAVTSADKPTIVAGDVPELVTLDGTGSFDPDGHGIVVYKWTVLYVPPGSSAALSDVDIAGPTFTADVVGSYLMFLQVTSSDPIVADSKSEPVAKLAPNSALVEVTVTTLNRIYSIPAQGVRAWADRFHAILTDIDANLGPLATILLGHTFSRTDADPDRFVFDDLRTVGAPFLTSDYLMSISNKNASGTGEADRGMIQLDPKPSAVVGEAVYGIEVTDGGGGMVLRSGPWRGILIDAPAPTGSDLTTAVQLGQAGSGLASARALLAFWDDTDRVVLFDLRDQTTRNLVAEVTVDSDIDVPATSRRYLRVYPAGSSLEDWRLRLERARLVVRKDMYAEVDPGGASADFKTNWGIVIGRVGAVFSTFPQFRYDEPSDVWVLKNIIADEIDAIAKGTGVIEQPRIERIRTVIFFQGIVGKNESGPLSFARDFRGDPSLYISVVGTPFDLEGSGTFYVEAAAAFPTFQFVVGVIPDAAAGANMVVGTDYWVVDILAIGPAQL